MPDAATLPNPPPPLWGRVGWGAIAEGFERHRTGSKPRPMTSGSVMQACQLVVRSLPSNPTH